MSPNSFDSGSYQQALTDLKTTLEAMTRAYQAEVSSYIEILNQSGANSPSGEAAMAAINAEREKWDKQKEATEQAIKDIEAAAKMNEDARKAQERVAKEKAKEEERVAKEQEKAAREAEKAEREAAKKREKLANETAQALAREAAKRKKADDAAMSQIADIGGRLPPWFRFLTGTGGDPNSRSPDDLGKFKQAEEGFGKLSMVLRLITGAFDTLAKIIAINTRLYRAETEVQTSLLNRDTLGAAIASRRGQSEAAQSAASMIPIIGGTIAKMIGAINDEAIAKLERQRSIEAAGVQKIQELANVSSLGIQSAKLEIAQMRIQMREAKALAPQLEEFTNVKIELENLRAQQATAKNLETIKESIATMKKELSDRREWENMDESQRAIIIAAQKIPMVGGDIAKALMKMAEERAKEEKKAQKDWEGAGMIDSLIRDLRGSTGARYVPLPEGYGGPPTPPGGMPQFVGGF